MPGTYSCGHEFKEGQLKLSEKRQVFNIPQPELKVKYSGHVVLFADKGTKGLHRKGLNAPAQYGNGIKAFAVLLNVHYKLPFKKIQLLFGDLFGYSINESTISTAGETCYEKLKGSERIIKSKIVAEKVVHADETGLRTAGKLYWLHTATTRLHTYLFIHEKRGAGAIQGRNSILPDYDGWLVHGCWSSYFNLEKLKHAICGAHILRELQGLVETDGCKWAKVFKSFLLFVYSKHSV